MSNTKEIFKRYSNYKKGFLEEDKLMDFDGFNKALGEILSLPVELPVSQENGGHLFNNQKENKMKNTPVDDTFIYKIVLQDTVVDEQKEERFVLARDFNDAVQLACEMCEANDYVVIQTTEIGYVDYCTSKIAEYFSRFSG